MRGVDCIPLLNYGYPPSLPTVLGIRPPGGGGIPLYKPYRYVPPQMVWFLRRFGVKTGIDFAHFGLELGMVFEETTEVYERMGIVSIPNESQRKSNQRIRNGF